MSKIDRAWDSFMTNTKLVLAVLLASAALALVFPNLVVRIGVIGLAVGTSLNIRSLALSAAAFVVLEAEIVSRLRIASCSGCNIHDPRLNSSGQHKLHSHRISWSYPRCHLWAGNNRTWTGKRREEGEDCDSDP
jgi:hypothetical protein